MRKSSLVKAMACFMAATMAITCVPSANVTNGVSVVAEAAASDTASTSIPDTVESNNAWWATFSKDYTLTGDFDVTFEIQTADEEIGANYDTPTIVFTNGVTRNDDANGYKEYAVIRSDYFGWGNDTLTYESDWDWADFTALMRNATITSNIVRSGNKFTMTNKIQGGNGKEYNYKVNFTVEDDPDTITMFYTCQNHSMTINSFVNKADFILNKDGVTFSDGVFTIDSSKFSDAFSENGVDLNKIFLHDSNTQLDTNAPISSTETNKVTCTLFGRTYELEYKQLSPVTCDNITVVSGQNSSITVQKTFDIVVSLSKTNDADAVITEIPTCDFGTYEVTDADGNVIQVPKATYTTKKSGTNTYTFTVTPAIAGENTATISCGTTAQAQTVTYTAYNNKCTSLTSSKGETYGDNTVYFLADTGSVNSLTVTALSDQNADNTYMDPAALPEIKQVTGTAITISTSASIDTINGTRNLTVVFDNTQNGEKELGFVCGDKELLIRIGSSASSGTTTGGSTSAGTSTPADTTSPDSSTTTGSAVDTTTGTDTAAPSDTTTGTDTTAPSDTAAGTDTAAPSDTATGTDTTAPSDSTTDTDTDTSTTTKKNAKISSVTAKKGKKVVSGKVTKKATVKVTVNKKTVKTTADKNGKFSVTVAKKLTKGTKIKVVVTKSGYKKATKTVTVK